MTPAPTFTTYGQYASRNYSAHCLVFTDSKGDEFYYSYETLVAARLAGHLFMRRNVWGSTTGKHLNWISRTAARVTEGQFALILRDYEALSPAAWPTYVAQIRELGVVT